MSARDTLKLDLAVDAAFDKINTKLSTIFQNDANRKQYSRSWIWELIQNARDNRSKDKGINIKVKLDESQSTLSFSHDGDYFSSESLIRLITQISSKIEDKSSTGRFGSGFISTHILSKKIKLQGIYKKENSSIVNLDFVLDRSAWDEYGDPSEYVHALKAQIKAGLQEVDALEDSDDTPTNNAQTCFVYRLENNDVLEYARIGLLDLEKQLPLVLAFNPEISSIEVNEYIYERTQITPDIETDSTRRSHYSITKSNVPFQEIFIIAQKPLNFQIAFFIEGKLFKSFYEQTSRLFCRFPLIGTETFSLPFVLNSELFEVTDTRDALMEEHPKNQKILDTALNLYCVAFDFFIKNDYKGYQHICQMGNNSFKLKARNEQISKCVMEMYSTKSIVKTYRGNTQTLERVRIPVINDNDYPKGMLSDERKNLFKQFCELIAICPNMEMPVCDECAGWAQVFQKSHITVENLCDMIIENLDGNKGGLLYILKKNGINHIDWLNNYIKLLVGLDKEQLLRNKTMYLDQVGYIIGATNGLIDNIQEAKLKAIYNRFFYSDGKCSIERKLFLRDLDLGHQIFKGFMGSKDNEIIAKEITNKARDLLALPKRENGKREQHVQDALNDLFYWINANDTTAQILFPAIYKDRMSLCSADEQLEHYQFSLQTKQELEKYQVESINDLVMKLKDSISSYLEAELLIIREETEKIFTNNVCLDDITRLLELNAIENEDMLKQLLVASRHSAEDIAEFLEYRRTMLDDAFHIVQELLKEAADRVKKHLSSKPGIYDLNGWSQIAPTVYDGVKKNGISIRIITRPRNNDKVILYYESEHNYLRRDCELWVVDTTKLDQPELLTFGDMVKITGIRVIPLWNLYNKQ